MTDLRQTSAMFNKYFQDRRIRRYLISAGLINRHGDILPPSVEQIARARRVTQQQVADDYYNGRENEPSYDERNNRSRVNFSPKRSRNQKDKSSKQTQQHGRGDSSSTRRSRSAVNKQRSTNRAKSAYQRSNDSIKSATSNPTRVKSPIKQRCRVSMIYYGPQNNFDYDNCWFKPDGDEILVSQQHCGGENLTVFRGHVKPNEIFTFESRRHQGYPFALALYVNGLVKSRISVCCEYKHKCNVPLDGKHGLFGIYNVQKVTPCLSCQYEREKKKSRKLNLPSTSGRQRYEKSVVPHSSAGKQSKARRKKSTSSSSSGSITPRRRSPVLSGSLSSSHSDEKTKRPVTAVDRSLHTDHKKNGSNLRTKTTNDGDNYSSDFEGSKDNEPSTTKLRHGQPHISDSNSTDRSQRSSPIPKQVIFKDNEKSNHKTHVPTETTGTTFDHKEKPSKAMSKKISHSTYDDSDQSSGTATRKTNNLSYARISPPKLQKDVYSSEEERRTATTKIGSKKANIHSSTRKLKSSEDDDDDKKKHSTNEKSNALALLMKSAPVIQEKFRLSDDEDDRSRKIVREKTSVQSNLRKVESSDDENHSTSGRNNTNDHSKKSSPTGQLRFDFFDEAQSDRSSKKSDIQNKQMTSDSSDNDTNNELTNGKERMNDASKKSSSTLSYSTDYSDEKEIENNQDARLPPISTGKKSPLNYQRKPQISSSDKSESSDDENKKRTSTARQKPKLFGDDGDDHSPRKPIERKSLFDSPRRSLSNHSRKSSHSSERQSKQETNRNETVNRLFSSTIRDDDTGNRRPLSSAVYPKKESNDQHTTRKTLYEDLFGEAEPPRTTNVHSTVGTRPWHSTVDSERDD
ncbi:hypothetical protein I4U23_001304 [Adineta vaga]|nr:hypothetical protein I4U23_001304 [Adineta vaga]